MSYTAVVWWCDGDCGDCGCGCGSGSDVCVVCGMMWWYDMCTIFINMISFKKSI